MFIYAYNHRWRYIQSSHLIIRRPIRYNFVRKGRLMMDSLWWTGVCIVLLFTRLTTLLLMLTIVFWLYAVNEDEPLECTLQCGRQLLAYRSYMTIHFLLRNLDISIVANNALFSKNVKIYWSSYFQLRSVTHWSNRYISMTVLILSHPIYEGHQRLTASVAYYVSVS